MKHILILSGGMDSATLLAELIHFDLEVIAVTFDYGQRHRREIKSASRLARHYGVRQSVINLSNLGQHLGGSALTDDIEVPHGHYAEESMKVTVVPNRNMIMLSIAWGIGVAERADYVATAVHAGDHHIYPDCRPNFVHSASRTLSLATAGLQGPFSLWTPYVEISKTDIARIGGSLNVPYELTWTCYEGGDIHCGQCGACQERREAFRDSGVTDPTEYRDNGQS